MEGEGDSDSEDRGRDERGDCRCAEWRPVIGIVIMMEVRGGAVGECCGV